MNCIAKILSLVLIAAALPTLATAAELVLVDRDAGIGPAPIIVYVNAPPRTRDAAVTLAEYIEKTCGVRPKLLDGKPEPLPDRAILVGYQPALRTLFPKLEFDFRHPEEIVIASNDNYLVIAGRDRWNPDHMEAKGRLAIITGRQQEYGTANAVYTFLRDQLHVRWLWPGETGEDIVPQNRIAFAPFEHRYHPQIRSRGGMFQKLSLGDNKEGPDELWARYQRVQLDSLKLAGGHAFHDWWDKYYEKHPDYFALQPDGTRGSWPAPNYIKLCDTNQAVWKQWLVEVEEQLKADPGKRVFNVSPNDGWPSGHCVCDRCRTWDHPDGEIGTWRWHKLAKDWPAITDRHVTFANQLGRLLKEKYPKRDYLVLLHAYGLSRPAPVEAVPDENVLISSVANFHLRGDGVGDSRTKSMAQFADWAKKAPKLAWRPNLGNPVGMSWGMPDIALKQAADDFRFVADNHCVGVFFDMLWFHWSTQGPHYYLLAHLAWNPYADADEIMDDYYRRAFGPAAADLKAYWSLMEKTRTEFLLEIPNRYRAFDVPQKYDSDFFARAGALLDQADAKVDDTGKYRDRIAFVRCGLDYAKLVVDTRRWMQKFEASKGKGADAIAKVLANWRAAESMKETIPQFAINWIPVFRQPDNKRMMGLHPDNPVSGRVKREFETRAIE